MKAMAGQDFRQGGHPGREGFPSHERHGPAARLVVRAAGHGRETGGVVVVEPDCLGGQSIKGGSSYRGVAIGADMVSTERVRNNPDDIHGANSREPGVWDVFNTERAAPERG